MATETKQFTLIREVNPVGYQVAYLYMRAYKIGTVKGSHKDRRTGATMLHVHHFNGEPWTDHNGKPLQPNLGSVEVIGPQFEGDPNLV